MTKEKRKAPNWTAQPCLHGVTWYFRLIMSEFELFPYFVAQNQHTTGATQFLLIPETMEHPQSICGEFRGY